jgi:hypothetical protein
MTQRKIFMNLAKIITIMNIFKASLFWGLYTLCLFFKNKKKEKDKEEEKGVVLDN